MDNEYYIEGVRAAQNYYNSQGYGGLTRYVRAEDAIKLFLPPVVEHLTQISSPSPKPRKDWIRGFKEEQTAILADKDKDKDKDKDLTTLCKAQIRFEKVVSAAKKVSDELQCVYYPSLGLLDEALSALKDK